MVEVMYVYFNFPMQHSLSNALEFLSFLHVSFFFSNL